MALVYKFSAGADNLTHLMENRTIRFTPPLELNDPFECGLYTDELFRASGAGVNERFLSSLIVTHEDVQHFNSFAIRAIVQRTNNQQYGILSLTHVRDDILMWAHYAKHHTGLVLGFDSENEFF